MIKCHMLEFKKFHKPLVTQLRPAIPVWKPPVAETFKTNFDGAIFENEGEAGIAVVIQNSYGEVMAFLSERIPMPSSVTVLEMLAARRAVLFAKEIGITHSIF